MKICYLTNNVDPKSGWGRFSSDLIFGVKSKGHDVTILKEIDDKLEGIVSLKRGLGIFISAIKARKYIKNCEVVHALDGYPYGIIAALANIGINKKLIISGVGTYSVEPLYNLKSGFLKWAYKRASSIVCISRYTKDQIIKKVRLNNTTVVSPGIDLGKFKQVHIDHSEKFMVSVGALKHRKGYHVSIPAFAAARKVLPNLKYKIVGGQTDKPYFNKLKNLANEYGVGGDVEFLENISDNDLKKLYASAQCFVLTSINENHHFEGFGLVFLEAAAAGLPVIGTLENGIQDSVKNGYNGLLVPQNNIKKTAEAIIAILSDSISWHNMSRESYGWAEENDLDKSTDKIINLYR